MKLKVLTFSILGLSISACNPNYQSHSIASADKEPPVVSSAPDMKKWLLPDQEIIIFSAKEEASKDQSNTESKEETIQVLPEEDAPVAKHPDTSAEPWPVPLDEGDEEESNLPPHNPVSQTFVTLTVAKTARPQDFKAAGNVTPTVYYIPLVNETKAKCKEEEKVPMLSTKGETLAKVCKNTYDGCALQGSCFITNKEVSTILNHISYRNGTHHFFEVDIEHCPFGQGVRSGCLDPYYTVAADLSIFKPGDVIYVPKVAGVVLPNGEMHHGYFIVRDTGGVIDGAGRFDFFSGFSSWRDKTNPFNQLKLTDKNTKVPYYKVTGETASMVKQARNFPSLPGFGASK